MRRFTRSNLDEGGFTLIELLVVVIIIGILASFAVILFLSQARIASLASVKEDIKSSTPLLVDNSSPTAFTDPSVFTAKARNSKDNTLGLILLDGSDGNKIACVWGYHTFSSTDKQYYSYFSNTGRIVDGDCYGGTTGTPPASGTGTGSTGTGSTGTGSTGTGSTGTGSTGTGSTGTGSTGTGSTGTGSTGTGTSTTGTTTAANGVCDGITVEGSVTYDCRYAPQTNKLSFCNTLYVSSSSATPTTWVYSIDTSKAPFYNADPATYTSVYNITTISYTNKIWKFKGSGYNDNVSTTSGSYQVGWCVPPLDPGAADASTNSSVITYNSQSGNYYASLDLVPSTTNKYPLVWSKTVDLKQYFKNMDGKQISWSNRLKVVDKGNYVYYVEGVVDDSRYLSATNTQSIGTAVAFYPNGADWKVQ